MKNLNQYIQEKYLIDIDTEQEKCETFSDLLNAYPDLKEVEINSNDKSAGFIKVLKCSDKISDIYTNFFKLFFKNIEKEFKDLIPTNYEIDIMHIVDYDKSKWYDIVISVKKRCLFDIIFNKNEPIIKIYSYQKNLVEKDLNYVAKIIYHILSK